MSNSFGPNQIENKKNYAEKLVCTLEFRPNNPATCNCKTKNYIARRKTKKQNNNLQEIERKLVKEWVII